MQVTDPVCGMRFDSGKAAANEVWQEDTYYLCSASCHELFKAAPERYVKRSTDSIRPPENTQ